MKSLMLVAVAALPLLTGCCSYHRTTAWEYRVVQGWSGPGSVGVEQDRAEFERQLNEAGSQGYAIASSTTVPGDASTKTKTIIIMKRPKQ